MQKFSKQPLEITQESVNEQFDEMFEKGQVVFKQMKIPINKVVSYFQDIAKEMFSCYLCEGVVVYPKECNYCQRHFCSQCLNDYLKDKHKCPGCLEIQLGQQFSDLNERLYKILQKIRFHDDKTTSVYKVFMKKQMKNSTEFECLNGCGKSVNKKTLLSHARECLFQKYKCSNCFYETEKDRLQDHSCFEIFIKHDEELTQKMRVNYQVTMLARGLPFSIKGRRFISDNYDQSGLNFMKVIQEMIGDDHKGIDHLNDNGVLDQLEDNYDLRDKLALYGYHSIVMKIQKFIGEEN